MGRGMESKELKSATREITQDGINLFHESFGGSNPIHTDAEAAKQTDYGAPVQHGIRTMFPIFAELARKFGKGFVEGGTLKVKFTAAVIAGDVITTHIRATEESQAEAGRQTFEVWAENAGGNKVLVGSASVKA